MRKALARWRLSADLWKNLAVVVAVVGITALGMGMAPRQSATEVNSVPQFPEGLFAHEPRVGIQSGHWKAAELPEELSVLRTSTGAAGNGWTEVGTNLDIATRVAGILSQKGIQVDLLPSTVPSDYRADAFISIHGDSNPNTALSGYKLARADWSAIPDRDDSLLNAVRDSYAAATGLPEHINTITDNMLQYYAFNNHKYQHAVDSSTPSIIVETGFLSNARDRDLLSNRPDVAAQAIADGVLKFLGK